MQGTANLQQLFTTFNASAPKNPPVKWVNNQTPLNAANLNTLTENIAYCRAAMSTIATDMNGAFDIIKSRNAGWRALGDNGSYTSGEVFNDYDRNRAIAPFSHAEGEGTTAYGISQHVQGRWNELPPEGAEDSVLNKYAHIIGGGTDELNRFNLHTIDWYGNAWFKGGITFTVSPEEGDPIEVSGSALYTTVMKLEQAVEELEKNSHAVHSGTSTPNDEIGNDGDIYIQLGEQQQ